MKLIELKGENDRGLRRLAIFVVCGIAAFVGFAAYHQKFEMAERSSMHWLPRSGATLRVALISG